MENTNGGFGRAALIDALYSNHPNDEFTDSINKTLKEAGIQLDVYKGEEVTVNLLENLKSGYKLIIFRMHSALSTEKQLNLFTAESYSVIKYVEEQFQQIVRTATAENNPHAIFTINCGFISRFMQGKLNGTLVIAMGCEGTLDPELIDTFLRLDAQAYIGWNGPVLLSHSDDAVTYLVQKIYIEKLSVIESVNETNRVIGEDSFNGTVLDYYDSSKTP